MSKYTNATLGHRAALAKTKITVKDNVKEMNHACNTTVVMAQASMVPPHTKNIPSLSL